MKNPIVSVIIPFYERADWLEKAVKSVFDQTFRKFEIIIVNDGSLEDISFIKKQYGPRIRIINQSNGGPSKARNTGIRNSKGKYLAFLDSDDYWSKNKLMSQVNFMENENYVWSHHSYTMVYENDKEEKEIDLSHLKGNVLTQTYVSFKAQTSCFMVLRNIILKENIFFPENERYGQDLVFYREIAKKYPLGVISESLSYFRIRGSNAGFRAHVQLLNKSNTWKKIKVDTTLLDELPNNVVLGYKLSVPMTKLYQKIAGNRENELLAKLFYALPYFLIKL